MLSLSYFILEIDSFSFSNRKSSWNCFINWVIWPIMIVIKPNLVIDLIYEPGHWFNGRIVQLNKKIYNIYTSLRNHNINMLKKKKAYT